ncbi:MAG: hypothetical protein AB7P69_06040 [Candidatus Binatia bacterium]
MRRPSVQTLAWGLRLIYVGIAFWWPAFLRDPIYTPRYARLAGQELPFPTEISFNNDSKDDAQALAIFWNWENRTLVSTRWLLGSYRGIRAPEGRMQTFIVLLLFWGIGSILLSRWESRTSSTTEPPRQRGVIAWLSTPVWQWFTRRP